jgi:hypothetical protein
MFTVPSPNGNASQNYTEIPSHAVRITILKKKKKSKFWQGCRGKGTLIHYWWECKLVQPLQKSVWRFIKKLKINLP